MPNPRPYTPVELAKLAHISTVLTAPTSLEENIYAGVKARLEAEARRVDQPSTFIGIATKVWQVVRRLAKVIKKGKAIEIILFAIELAEQAVKTYRELNK